MREAFALIHKHKLNTALDEKTIKCFINTNPEFYDTYSIVGNYYKEAKDNVNARKYYELALTKEITTVQDKERIEKSLKEIQNIK